MEIHLRLVEVCGVKVMSVNQLEYGAMLTVRHYRRRREAAVLQWLSIVLGCARFEFFIGALLRTQDF
jgi:hypothetical protein